MVVSAGVYGWTAKEHPLRESYKCQNRNTKERLIATLFNQQVLSRKFVHQKYHQITMIRIMQITDAEMNKVGPGWFLKKGGERFKILYMFNVQLV